MASSATWFSVYTMTSVPQATTAKYRPLCRALSSPRRATRKISGGMTKHRKASVRPPTALSMLPKYGARIATITFSSTRQVRRRF